MHLFLVIFGAIEKFIKLHLTMQTQGKVNRGGEKGALGF